MKYIRAIGISLLLCLIAIIGFVSFHLQSQGHTQSSTSPIANVSPSPQLFCTRNKPYSIPDKLQKAIAFIQQKLYPTDPNGKNIPTDAQSLINCLDLKYADLSKATPNRGFVFDIKNSTRDDLRITIDNSYQSFDTYFTALVLVHAISYAGQYENAHHGYGKLSCEDQTIQAFENEKNFLATFSQQEGQTIANTIQHTTMKTAPPLQDLLSILLIDGKAKKDCQNNTDLKQCYIAEFDNKIKTIVENDQSYQEECNNNLQGN